MTEKTKRESVCLDIWITNKERYLQYLSGAIRSLQQRNSSYPFNPPTVNVGDVVMIHRACRIKYVPRSFRFKITGIIRSTKKDIYSGKRIVTGYIATLDPIIHNYYLVYQVHNANGVHYFLKDKPYHEIKFK